MFSDPALAAAELRAVLAPELVARIDWSSLEPAPANFVGAVFRQRYGDLVFQARLVGGGEVSATIEETMMTGYEKMIQQGMEMGMEKGMEKGMEQGQRGMLLRQLARRFGPLPGEVTARVAGAHSEELERWAERVLDAKQLDEVFAP